MTSLAPLYCNVLTCFKTLCRIPLRFFNPGIGFVHQERCSQRRIKLSKQFVRALSSSAIPQDFDITQLSSSQEENIIFTLNTFSKDQLIETGIFSPLMLDEICCYRARQGLFLSLGDVLAISGMDNDTMKKICYDFKAQPTKPFNMMQAPDYFKYFNPSLSTEFLENVHTITSLEVCLDSVCYVSLLRNGQLTDWGHIPLLGSNHIKQSPAEILEQALHVIPQLPKTDIYLLEERSSRKTSPQYIQIHMFLARLQTAIQALMSAESLSQNGSHSFYNVKDFFSARVFDLRVGGERVSGQHIVQQMEDGSFPCHLKISQSLWSVYHKVPSGIQKERYANCLLLSLAFDKFIGPWQSINK